MDFSKLPKLKRRCYQAMHHQESDVIPYTIYLYPDLEKKLDEYYGGRDKWPKFENHTLRILRPEWKKDGINNDGTACDPYGCKFDITSAAMKLIEYPLKTASLKGYKMPDIMPDYLMD